MVFPLTVHPGKQAATVLRFTLPRGTRDVQRLLTQLPMLWNSWPACVAGDAIAGGGAVLVHCSSGVSRSGTVVLAYLIARCGLLLKDAWELVSARRRVVLPNNLFHRVGAAG